MGTRKPAYLSLTDLFCGAGGASIGAEAAGLKLALGVNHWPLAIETHSQNFPEAAHDCRNISDVHPSRYGSTHLLWASPECTTLSQARGKKRNYTGQLPLDEEFEPLPTEAEIKSRVHPLDVVRFAEHHRYEAIVVENVVEECLWGLLPQWFQMMEALGYQHRTLYLNSMFFGVPQSRDRVYFVFWKKGNRAPDLEFRPSSWCPRCEEVVEAVQSFKPRCAPTRRYRQQYVYLCPTCTTQALPFVTPAAAAIDWSVLGERIGDKKRPLAAATMARIQAGIDRYWRGPTTFDLDEPLATQTGRQSQALYIPLMVHTWGAGASHIRNSATPVDEPMRTITAEGNHHYAAWPPLYVKNFTARGDHHALLNPPFALVDSMRSDGEALPPDHPLRTSVAGQARGGHRPALVTALRTHGSALPADHPLRTIVGGNVGHALVTSYYGREHVTRPATEPLGTVTAEPKHALLTSYYRTNVPHPADDPMGTLSTRDRHALINEGETPAIEDCLFRMLMPAEIGRGMAFDDRYEVAGTQRERTQQYGQAVTPPVAQWIWTRVVESLR